MRRSTRTISRMVARLIWALTAQWWLQPLTPFHPTLFHPGATTRGGRMRKFAGGKLAGDSGTDKGTDKESAAAMTRSSVPALLTPRGGSRSVACDAPSQDRNWA